MTILSPVAGQFCNSSTQLFQATPDFSSLSAPLRSFYRWIKRWFDQTGDVSPSTRYLAFKQKVTERCIYKRLKALSELGFLRLEVTPGVERKIIPLVDLKPKPKQMSESMLVPQKDFSFSGKLYAKDAPVRPPNQPAPAPQKSSPVQGLVQGSSSGVTPYRLSTQGTQDAITTTATSSQGAVPDLPVVVELVKNGIGKSVAQKLAQEASEETIRQQIEALPYRRFQDKAAFLVSAIRNAFALPAALQEEKEQRVKAQKQRELAAMAQVLKTKKEQDQQRLLDGFQRLPQTQQAELQHQAEEQAFKALPREIAERTRARGGPVWRSSVRTALLHFMESHQGADCINRLS